MMQSTSQEMKKQVSIFLPVSDWRALRFEAARRRIPMTELCRHWMRPELDRLRHAAALPGPQELRNLQVKFRE
ncbi:MAG: hypothetical protein KDA78_19815, partial [Planctomycetaceae bacterium]|nr:hypothetical protein [Planctomycetaceae bacterium]